MENINIIYGEYKMTKVYKELKKIPAINFLAERQDVEVLEIIKKISKLKQEFKAMDNIIAVGCCESIDSELFSLRDAMFNEIEEN